MVADAPGWADHLPALREFAGTDVLVAHNAGFDMAVIVKTSEAFGLAVPDYRSLCSLQVARKTYHLESYRLPVAAMAAGFEDFSHHDALADAEACAAIIVHAATRHEADDVERLAHITRVPFGAIGSVATRQQRSVHGPMALQ
jgi:DNA polymerase-3 subunit epsilon